MTSWRAWVPHAIRTSAFAFPSVCCGKVRTSHEGRWRSSNSAGSSGDFVGTRGYTTVHDRAQERNSLPATAARIQTLAPEDLTTNQGVFKSCRARQYIKGLQRCRPFPFLCVPPWCPLIDQDPGRPRTTGSPTRSRRPTLIRIRTLWSTAPPVGTLRHAVRARISKAERERQCLRCSVICGRMELPIQFLVRGDEQQIATALGDADGGHGSRATYG